MKRKISLSASLVLVLLASLLTFLVTNSAVTGQFAEKLEELDADQLEFQKLATIDSIVREHYVKSVDKTAVSEGSIAGYVEGLGDKYSRYLTAQEYADYLIAREEKTTYDLGFSVAYNEESGLCRICHVESASEVKQFGMTVGDTLVSIGGVSVEEQGIDAVRALLTGEKDAATGVSVLRDGEPITYTVTYRRTEKDLVVGRLVHSQAGVITIRSFESETETELKRAIDSMLSSGADALLFDVRSLRSLSFEDAVACADVIAGVGELARRVTGGGTVESLSGDGASIPLDCAVLIDGGTAGAPELFAAILRDTVGAKLVGETSGGVCGVQADIKLNDSSAIILTTKQYLPPVSDSFEDVGLSPDLEWKSTVDFRSIDPEEDEVLCEGYYLLKPDKRPSGEEEPIVVPDESLQTETPTLIEPGM